MKTFDCPPFDAFDKIIVTGPQRCGTRFVAAAIAQDRKLAFVGEEAIGVRDLITVTGIIEQQRGWVMQGPALSYAIRTLARPDVLVVWMRRHEPHWVASCERVGWNCESEESRIPEKYKKPDTSHYQQRYAHWCSEHRPAIVHWIEVEYESLREHPLFVPTKLRAAANKGAGFATDQVRLCRGDR